MLPGHRIKWQCLQRLKQRRNVLLYELDTNLLRAVKEELCKDTVSNEHLIELLSMLAAKKENLLKLILLTEIKEKLPMNELEEDIVKTVDYHDNIIYLWKARAMMMTESNSEWESSHQLSGVNSHSSRLTLMLRDVVSLAPRSKPILDYDRSVIMEDSKPKKSSTGQPLTIYRWTWVLRHYWDTLSILQFDCYNL